MDPCFRATFASDWSFFFAYVVIISDFLEIPFRITWTEIMDCASSAATPMRLDASCERE